MLPKKKRVTKELFHSIMKNGKTLSSPLFVFRYIPQGNPQFAFVAPKSVAKQANKRNTLRKQGYSTLRTYPISKNAGIFFYKKGSQGAPFSQIKQEIKEILQKTHII